MSTEELERLEVIRKVVDKHLTQAIAARQVGVTVRQIKRLHLILYLMHTGCQWYKLPIDKDKIGRPEISYSRLFRHFQHWITSGFFDRFFEASVAKLAKESLLDTSVLHGDGTTTAAKKRATILVKVATSI